MVSWSVGIRWLVGVVLAVLRKCPTFPKQANGRESIFSNDRPLPRERLGGVGFCFYQRANPQRQSMTRQKRALGPTELRVPSEMVC